MHAWQCEQHGTCQHRILEWDSQPCFAHTLQLATNDGFKLLHIIYVAASASRLVSHFHHSSTATQALNQKHQLQNLPEHKLVQYCWTRWNSIHDMFKRLPEQRWAISAVLSDTAFTKLSDARTLELTNDSWGVTEELLTVLHSLKCATTALCGESGVSISIPSDSNSSIKTPQRNHRRVSQSLSVQANSVYFTEATTCTYTQGQIVNREYREQSWTAGPFQAEPVKDFFFFFYYTRPAWPSAQLQRNAVSVFQTRLNQYFQSWGGYERPLPTWTDPRFSWHPIGSKASIKGVYFRSGLGLCECNRDGR